MSGPKPKLPRKRIADFCKRWKVREFALFGSILREDFYPESDVDVLVEFQPDARWSLFDHVTMQDELRELFGRDVDLVTKKGLERSRNHVRRRAILESARVIHDTP
jgi:predicted nucleotidyltransferase